jgi:hypothetical protein
MNRGSVRSVFGSMVSMWFRRMDPAPEGGGGRTAEEQGWHDGDAVHPDLSYRSTFMESPDRGP